MQSPMFGEFMGTMVLVLLGNGVIAAFCTSRLSAKARRDVDARAHFRPGYLIPTGLLVAGPSATSVSD